MKFQWLFFSLLILCHCCLPTHAAQAIQLPEGALDYRQLIKIKDLPKCEIAALPAMVDGVDGPPVMLWENQGALEINLPLPSVGKFEIEIYHLSGGRYPALKYSAYDKILAVSANVKETTQIQITRFTTPLWPGQTLPLQISTTDSKSPIGLLAVIIRIAEFLPLSANHWQYGQVDQSVDQLINQYAVDQKAILDMPVICRQSSNASTSRVTADTEHSLLATTYLYHDHAFTGYSFRLKSNVAAELWINGEKVIDLPKSDRTATGAIPWNKLQRGVNRMCVLLPQSQPASDDTWFELLVSDLEHTHIFSQIPEQLDPRRIKMDWPRLTLSKGDVRAVLPLPDSDKGFYRAARFEWAGQMTELRVGKNTIFVPFHDDHQPLGVDHAAGPAEEFFEPIGYEDALPGESFIKLGVGLLRKPVENKYFFGSAYLPDTFLDWQTQASQDRVRYMQTLKDHQGYAYRYVKELILTNQPNGLIIEHQLTNTGTKRIVSNHYSHNFIRLNDTDIDKRYQIDFNFTPIAVNNVRSRLSLKGKRAIPLGKGTIFTPMYGFSKTSDSQLILSLIPDNLKLTITLDQPMIRFWLFASNRTLCPEMFTHIDLAPGQTKRWVRRYEVSNSESIDQPSDMNLQYDR